jgi:tetratricopeptide (TPR) repeat protein
MKKYYFFLLIMIVTLSCNNSGKEYQNAVTENTIQAYEKFLEKYPNSQFAEDARNKIISMEYAIADSINTIEEYNHFIKKYPDCEYAGEVKKRIMSMEYAIADSINTIDAYTQFLQKYPDNEFEDKVHSKIFDLNTAAMNKKLKENTGWEIKKVWDIKSINYSKLINQITKKEGSTTAKPGHYLAAIEFHQYKKKEVEFKIRDIKIIDSLSNIYYPVGIAPFSIIDYVPFSIFGDLGMANYVISTEEAVARIDDDGSVSLSRNANKESNISKASSELKFFLVYNIPKKHKIINVKIMDYDPVSFKMEK